MSLVSIPIEGQKSTSDGQLTSRLMIAYEQFLRSMKAHPKYGRMASSLILMLRAAGLDFNQTLQELDEETAYAALTTFAELSLMVRDGRSATSNPQAAEFYAKFFLSDNDA